MGELFLPPIDQARKFNEGIEDEGDKLQVILAGDNVKSGIPKHPPLVSKARQRFARATLSVLNQVIEKKKMAAEESCKDDDEKYVTEQPETEKADTVQNNELDVPAEKQSQSRFPVLRQASIQSQDGRKTRPEKRKRKPSLASVVNMAQFRKNYMSRLMAQAEEQPSPVPESPEIQVPEALPERPRFIATLSPEAQFAALKAYEDVLVDKLQTSYPEQRNNLYRVRTPQSKRVSFPVEPKNEYPNQGNAAENHDDNDLTSGLSTSNYSLTSKTYHQRDDSRVKRRLTVSFQVGMDILDKLKSSQGMMITSPRIISGEYIEPVTSYNKWIHNWACEFSLNEK